MKHWKEMTQVEKYRQIIGENPMKAESCQLCQGTKKSLKIYGYNSAGHYAEKALNEKTFKVDADDVGRWIGLTNCPRCAFKEGE